MFDYKNKTKNLRTFNDYIFAKTLNMFKYENLPDTLPEKELEKILQYKGHGIVTESDGELYAIHGNFSGKEDAYGNNLYYRIDNIYLKLHKELEIKTDGVMIYNDYLGLGLYPLVERYNSLLVENEITMYTDTFNNRINMLISASDDKTRESAEKYLEKVEQGELGIIGENRVFEGIRTHNSKTNAQNTVIQLIEFNQYLKASLHNEIGLNTNYNMKRERLSVDEVNMNQDSLQPFIDSMLENRKSSVDKINEKYGTDITVELNSVWGEEKDGVLDSDNDHSEPSENVDTESFTDEPETEPSETDEPDEPETEPSETDEPETEPSETDEPETEPSETDEPETDLYEKEWDELTDYEQDEIIDYAIELDKEFEKEDDDDEG